MAKTKEANPSGSQELLENPEALQEQISKAEDIVKKNKNMIAIILGAVVLFVFGMIYLNGQNAESEVSAQMDIYPAEYYFAMDSTNIVLNGDGGRVIGVSEIADIHDGTAAGNLAKYYEGVVLLKQGDFNGAIASLEEFEANDLLVQARAYSLIGDAKMELGDVKGAIESYVQAVEYRPTEQYTPRYMMKLSTAYEVDSQWAEAALVYEKLISDYGKAVEAADAKKFLARARGLGAVK